MVLAVGTLLGLPQGCSERERHSEVVPLEGKIEKVDAKADGTGEIAVSYFSEKQNQEIVGTGQVTRETEIMINGVVSRLSDLRLGERIRGDVRVEKQGNERRQIVLKIYADRAVTEPGTSAPTSTLPKSPG